MVKRLIKTAWPIFCEDNKKRAGINTDTRSCLVYEANVRLAECDSL